MVKNYNKYLCCPKCNNILEQKNRKIICNKCKLSYSEKLKIPILYSKELSIHNKKQIQYFKAELLKRKKYKLEEWQKSYIKRIKNNFFLKKNKLFIDIGSGSGYVTIEIAKLGLKVISCDLNIFNLIKLKKIAQKLKLDNRITFVCCNAEELPLKTKIADYITLNSVLEHIPSEHTVLKEITRISKSNTQLMVTVPMKYRYLFPLFVPFHYVYDIKIGHLRRYCLSIIKSKLNNWKIKKVLYTGHIKKSIKIIINMFIQIFDEKKIEEEDEILDDKSLFASNLIVFLDNK